MQHVWCHCGKLVYAATHPLVSDTSVTKDILCFECSMVRCDAYPGSCKGFSHYD